MVDRFKVDAVNEVQSLTGGGANMASMGITAFEPQKMSAGISSPALDPNVGAPKL